MNELKLLRLLYIMSEYSEVLDSIYTILEDECNDFEDNFSEEFLILQNLYQTSKDLREIWYILKDTLVEIDIKNQLGGKNE